MIMELLSKYPIVLPYLAIVSIIAIIVTIKDKISAKMDKRRTPEARLMLISALGGSVAMLLTMLVIRHKTKHLKFMIGIPLIIVLQAVVLYSLYSIGFLL